MSKDKKNDLIISIKKGKLSADDIKKSFIDPTSIDDLLSEDEYGDTALYWAAKLGNKDVLKALLKKLGDEAGQELESILRAAITGEQDKIIELIFYGVINRGDSLEFTDLLEMEELEVSKTLVDKILSRAIKKGRKEIIEYVFANDKTKNKIKAYIDYYLEKTRDDSIKKLIRKKFAEYKINEIGVNGVKYQKFNPQIKKAKVNFRDIVKKGYKEGKITDEDYIAIRKEWEANKFDDVLSIALESGYEDAILAALDLASVVEEGIQDDFNYYKIDPNIALIRALYTGDIESVKELIGTSIEDLENSSKRKLYIQAAILSDNTKVVKELIRGGPYDRWRRELYRDTAKQLKPKHPEYPAIVNKLIEDKEQIEKEWEPQSDQLLTILDEEWEASKKVVADFLSKSDEKKLPFRLSRKELKELDHQNSKLFKHSLLVLSDEKGGYKIGMAARAKAYISQGKLVKEGILGHGGFGVVKAIKWEDGSIDAVKIESDKDDQSLEEEIMQDLGRLKAAFVRKRASKTKWIAGQRITNKKYTVQKRHSGIDINDYFNKLDDNGVSLDEIDKYEIALKLAKAIKELHNMGILHCDIKPENFMINYEGQIATVSAIDFGFSKRLDPDKEFIVAETAMGTKGFAAPEIENKKRYSKESDVYALGATFQDLMPELFEWGELKTLARDMKNEHALFRPTMDTFIDTIFSAMNKKFSKDDVKRKTKSVQKWMRSQERPEDKEEISSSYGL